MKGKIEVQLLFIGHFYPFLKTLQKWNKVSTEQHFKMLGICGLSAFFADVATGLTLRAFWNPSSFLKLFIRNPSIAA